MVKISKEEQPLVLQFLCHPPSRASKDIPIRFFISLSSAKFCDCIICVFVFCSVFCEVVFVALSISNHWWLSLQMTVTVGNLLGATMTRILRSGDGAICSQVQGAPCLQSGHHTDKYPSLCTDIQICCITEIWTCKAYQCPISLHNCPYTPCGHSSISGSFIFQYIQERFRIQDIFS